MTLKMLSQLCNSLLFSDLECTLGSATDIAPTFAAAKPANFGALLSAWAPAFCVNRGRIAALAQEASLAILASVTWASPWQHLHLCHSVLRPLAQMR